MGLNLTPKRVVVLSSLIIILALSFLLFKINLTGYVVASYDGDGKLISEVDYKTKDINVVFIVVDALRADHLGSYDYERDTSPNIDEFASESLLFKRAYVQWPRTIPSMTSMFSSTYPHTNGIMRTEKISNELVMLPEILKSNGYATLGAINNPVLSREFNIDQGFDEYIVVNDGMDFFDLSDAQKLTEGTIDWIEQKKDGKFFAWIHYMDPHAPYNMALKNKEHDVFIGDEYYHKIKKAAPVGDFALLGVIPNSANLDNNSYLDYYVSQYDAEIHYSDKWVGKLLDYLKESGLDENTLVILTSDHGESLADHNYFFNHGAFTYDATVHVPLIMRYPNELKKGEVDAAVPCIDLAPTILDLLDIPVSDTMQGNSLLPLIFKNKNQNKFIFTEAREMPHAKETKSDEFYSLSIRDDKYKLIRNIWMIKQLGGEKLGVRQQFYAARIVSGNKIEVERIIPPDYELYDTINDPSEKNNLLIPGNPRFNEIKESLEEELDNWFKNSEKFKYSSEGIPELSTEKLEIIKSLGYMN